MYLVYCQISLHISLMAKTVKLEEYFINAYVSELFEYESAISATHRMRRILDAKEKKADLNEVMN